MTNFLILIVDDDPSSSALAIKILKHHGYSVDLEETGEDALAYCSKATPQLILLDIMLPGISGTEVLKKLRQLSTCAAIPIVALTAHALPEIIKEYMEAGFTDYLTKPYTIDALVNKVKQHSS